MTSVPRIAGLQKMDTLYDWHFLKSDGEGIWIPGRASPRVRRSRPVEQAMNVGSRGSYCSDHVNVNFRMVFSGSCA